MSELTKNVKPVEGFDWDAYENGDADSSISREELTSKYDDTLNVVRTRKLLSVRLSQ